MDTDGTARKAPVEMQAEEARLSFSDCLERAGYRSERILITRFGKPLAAIVSIEDLNRLEQEAA